MRQTRITPVTPRN